MPIQLEPLTTLILTERTESTLLSDETYIPPKLITTPMFNNLLRCTNKDALLKGQIQDLATEIESVKVFMKEQLYLLNKSQKDKNNEVEHSNENAELAQLLGQQNVSSHKDTI